MICTIKKTFRRTATAHSSGFTLVEILIVIIILGIVARVVIPQFSNASQDSSAAALKEQLHKVRAAIAAYRHDHLETWPDLSSAWTPLLTKTNAKGGLGSGPLFGPYLPEPPINAISGGSHITTSAEPGVDYVWSPSTGTLSALDGEGNLFNENQPAAFPR